MLRRAARPGSHKLSCSPHSLIVLSVLLIVLGLLLARILADTAAHPATAAWDLARQAGSYHFTADVVQRVRPVARVTNVGHSERSEQLHMAGRADLATQTMEMQLWMNGGSAALPETATEIRIEGSMAWARQPGQAWSEAGNLGGTFAPGSDFLSYLAGATDIQAQEHATRTLPTGSTIGYTRYTFRVHGPAFANFLREQMQTEMTRQGTLVPGTRVGIARLYRDMTGTGELWVRDDGLPLRQVLHLTFPEDDGEQVSAEITTTFSQFGDLPVQATFATWPARAARHLNTLAVGTLALLPQLLAIALIAGAAAVLIIHRRSRRLAAALALSISGILILEPLLINFKQVDLGATRRAQAAEQQREQEIFEQRNAVMQSYTRPTADPHTAPLVLAQQQAQIQADDADYLIDDYADEHDNSDPNDDDDGDGLLNAQEWLLGTSSSTDDADDDDIEDGRDSDLDGITDYDEVYGFTFGDQQWYTDPLEADTNRDHMPDGGECVLDDNGRLVECPDRDDDGVPDVYDRDNDGDGVPDHLDLSPDTSLGTSGQAAFSADNAFNYDLTKLEAEQAVYVQFQLRPTNPDHLWYALNVLDWPQDRQGGIQDDDGNTYADVSDSGGDNGSNEFGDMKLLPMLELRINTADNRASNLPLADAPGDIVTLQKVSYYRTSEQDGNGKQVSFNAPLYGDEVGTVTLEQNDSGITVTPDDDLTSTSYSRIEVMEGACTDHKDDPTTLHTLAAEGGQLSDEVFKDWQIDPADGQRRDDQRSVVTRDNGGTITACGTISQRSFEGDAMIDHELLGEYGISVRDADRSGKDKLVHVPLQVISDHNTDERVAFQGKMFYQARGTWDHVHQARLVWVVQALVDECKRGATEDTVCTDYAYHNTPRVVHAYDDDWFLTGMHVREDHGADLAIFHEDITIDPDPEDDYSLGVVAKGLEERYLEADTDLEMQDFGRRFDHDENGSTSPEETWQLRYENDDGTIDKTDNVLQVQTYAGDKTADDYRPYYAHLDELVADVATARNGRDYGLSEATLRDHFQSYVEETENPDLMPTLLFAQSQHFRANNLDSAREDGTSSVTWDSDSATLYVSFEEPPDQEGGAPEPLPDQEMHVVNWVPYQYDADEDTWNSVALDEYWDELERRYDKNLHPADFDIEGGNTDENYAGLLFLFQLDYAALFYGLTFEVKNTPAPHDPSTDETITTKTAAGSRFLFEYFTKYRLDKQDYIKKAITTLGEIKTGLNEAPGKVSFLKSKFIALGQWIKSNKVLFGAGIVALIVLIVLIVTLDVYDELTGDSEQKTITAILVGVFGGLYILVQATLEIGKFVGFYVVEGTVSKALNKTIMSNSYKAATKAVVFFAVVIAFVIAFFFIKTVLEADIAFGSVEFEYLLAYTIATLIALILIVMVNLIPVIGQVLGLIILVVDTILMLLELPTFTELVTKAIFWVIYGLDVMVEAENTTRRTWMELEDPDQGTQVGNSITFGMELATEASHKPPKSWQAHTYLWKWSEDNLRDTTFAYQLAGKEQSLTVARGEMSSAWGNVHVYKEYATTDMWRGEHRDNYERTVELDTAGINQSLDIWLNLGYAIPALSCWTVYTPPPVVVPIPVCRNRTIEGNESSDIGSTIILDVFPSTLDDFFALTATDNNGRRLAWDNRFPALHDSDGDGLVAGTYNGSDPNDRAWDSDGDGLGDHYELEARERGTALSPIAGDTDGDGLTDAQEMRFGSNPANRDTDGDGLTDAEEVYHQVYVYNEEKQTWDATGQWQGGWEIQIDYAGSSAGNSNLIVRVSSDPANPDSDDDGISDLAEQKLEHEGHHGYHPLVWNENPIGILNHLASDSEYVRPGEPINFTTEVQNSKSDVFVRGTLQLDLPDAVGGGTETRGIDIEGNESTSTDFRFSVHPDTASGTLDIPTLVRAQTRTDPTQHWSLNDSPGSIGGYGNLRYQALTSGEASDLESFLFAAQTSSEDGRGKGEGDILSYILESGKSGLDKDEAHGRATYFRGGRTPDVACTDDGTCLVVWEHRNNCNEVTLHWLDVEDNEDVTNESDPRFYLQEKTGNREMVWLWGHNDVKKEKYTINKTESFCGPSGVVLYELDDDREYADEINISPDSPGTWTEEFWMDDPDEHPAIGDYTFRGKFKVEVYSRQIYDAAGAIVGTNGSVRKEQFSLSSGTGADKVGEKVYRPIVASDGSAFVALWDYNDHDGYKTYARRIAADGALGDPYEVLLGDNPVNMHNPEMVWEGDSYRVVYANGDNTLYTLRLNQNGQYIDGSHKLLEQYNYTQPHAQLAYSPLEDTTLVLYHKDAAGSDGWLQARLRIGDGDWSEPQQIAAGSYPQVGYEPVSQAWIIAWSDNTSNGQFQARMFTTDRDRYRLAPLSGANAEPKGAVAQPDRADLACPSSRAAPVFDFRFDEDAGATTFANRSSGSVARCLNDDQCPNAGVTGRNFDSPAVSFNGRSQALVVYDEGTTVRNQFSVSTWVYPRSRSGEHTILSGSPIAQSSEQPALLRIKDGRYEAGSGNYAVLSAEMPDSDVDTWVHLALTYEGDTWTLYRNGNQVATQSNPDRQPIFMSGWTMGVHMPPGINNPAPTGYLDGWLDDLAIYRVALRSDQIRTIYNDSVLVYCQLAYAADNPDDTITTRRYQLIDETEQPGEARNDTSVTVIVDGDQPTAQVTSLQDGTYINGNTSVTIGGEASDPTSPIAVVRVSTDGGATWQDANGAESWAYTLDATTLPEGPNTILVQAEDIVGNQSTPAATAIIIDGTPPVTTDTLVEGVIQRAPYAQQPDGPDAWVLPLNGTVLDPPAGAAPGAGVQHVDVRLDGTDSAACSGEQRATPGADGQWSLEYPFESENPTGTYQMNIAATDNLDNRAETTIAISKTVLIDNNAPAADLRYTAPTGDITRIITRSTTIGGVLTDTGSVASGPAALEWSLIPAERADVLESIAGNTVLDMPFDGQAPYAYEDTSGNDNHARCSGENCPPVELGGLHGGLPGYSGALFARGDFNASLHITDSTTLNFDSDDSFSVQAWMRLSDQSGSRDITAIQQIGQPGHSFRYKLYGTSAPTSDYTRWQPGFSIIGGVGQSIDVTGIADNDMDWHHMVGVVSNTHALSNTIMVQLYVDGELAATETRTHSDVFPLPNSGSGQIEIGRGQPHPGWIDDVRIFNRGLSATEVAALYYDGLRQWQPAQVVPDTPTTATWSAVITDGIEGFYQLDIRGIDAIGNRNEETGDWNIWRGEIDTRAPQVSIDFANPFTTDEVGLVYRCYAQDLNLVEQTYACPTTLTTPPVREEQRIYYDSDWWRRYSEGQKRLIGIDQQHELWNIPNALAVSACDSYGRCSTATGLEGIISLDNQMAAMSTATKEAQKIEQTTDLIGGVGYGGVYISRQDAEVFVPEDIDPANPIPLNLGIILENGVQSVTWLMNGQPISTVTALEIPTLPTMTEPFTLEHDFVPPLDPANPSQWLQEGPVVLSAQIVDTLGDTYEVPSITIGLDSLPPDLALPETELSGFEPDNPTAQLTGSVQDANWIDEVLVNVGDGTWQPATLEGEQWSFDMLRPQDMTFADGKAALPQPGQDDPSLPPLLAAASVQSNGATTLAQSGQGGHTSVPQAPGEPRPVAPDGETQPVTVRAVDTAGHTTDTTQDVVLDSAPPAPVVVQLAYRDSSGVEQFIGADGLVPAAPVTLLMAWGESSDGSGVQDYAAVWNQRPTLTLAEDGTAPDLTSYAPDQERRHAAPAEEAQILYAHLVIRDVYDNATVQTFGPVYVDSPHTADILRGHDGMPLHDYDAWRDSGCSLLGTSYEAERNTPESNTRAVAQQFFATWDADGLRMDWDGTAWNGDGDLFIYLDTGAGGTTQALNPYAPTAMPTATIGLTPRPPEPQTSSSTVYLPLVSRFATSAQVVSSSELQSPAPASYTDPLRLLHRATPTAPANVTISSAITAYPSTVGLPFAADYTLWLTDTEHIYLLRWDDSSGTWIQARTVPAGSHAWYAPGPQRTSLYLPFEWLGITAPNETALNLVALASEEDALQLWATMPASNPLNSPRVANPALSPAQRAAPFALTHAYHWDNLDSGICPATDNARGAALEIDMASTPGTRIYSYLGDSLYFKQREVETGGAITSADLGFLQQSYSPVAPGSSVEYTLTYANAGQYAASGAGLVVVAWPPLTLPDGTRKNDPARGPYDELVIPLGDLAPGSNGTQTVRVQVAPDATAQQGALDITLYDAVSMRQHPAMPLERVWADVAIDQQPPEVALLLPDVLPPTSEQTIIGSALDPSGVREMTLSYQVLTGTVQTVACVPASTGGEQWHCPLRVTNPIEGTSIRMQTRAIDRNGFTSEWTRWHTRVIDATPPQVSASATMQAGELVFRGVVTDNRSAGRVEVCPQDADTGACYRVTLPSRRAVQSWSAAYPLARAVDGEPWVFAVAAVDAVGNVGASETLTPTVDIVPPALAVTQHQERIDLATYRPDTPDPAARQPVLAGTIHDGGGLSFVEVLIQDQSTGEFGSDLVDQVDSASGTWNYTLLPLSTGSYRLRVLAYDQAGNVQRSDWHAVVVE